MSGLEFVTYWCDWCRAEHVKGEEPDDCFIGLLDMDEFDEEDDDE